LCRRTGRHSDHMANLLILIFRCNI
jgi:hypothetical protein